MTEWHRSAKSTLTAIEMDCGDTLYFTLRDGGELAYYWTFGDGGFSTEVNLTYVYRKPGMYAVTLVVDDRVNRASRTYVITVDGEPAAAPHLVLRSPDEYTFRNRTVNVLDVYGWPDKHLPHSCVSLPEFRAAFRPQRQFASSMRERVCWRKPAAGI